MTIARKMRMFCLAAGVAAGTAAHADGHGPLFGLATPTLGEDQWSSDTAVMTLTDERDSATMIRQMLGYGIGADLQLMFSFPLGRPDALSQPPNTRGGSMMAGFRDLEAGLLWRFDREAPDVGKRRESTLMLSAVMPHSGERQRGVEVTPGLNIGAVTGYASRSTYWWLGGGAQLRASENGERLGHLYYLTGVFGWRPPVFRGDYPKPDWRLFLEAVAETAERDRQNGVAVADSGGKRLLAGPSTLGLFGAWGVSAGVLFPLTQSLNSTQTEEDYRAKLVVTYWF